MAIGLRRKVRLDSRRERQAITRRKNGAIKNKERARRDARIKAKLAALPEGASLPGDVASWAARQTGKRTSQLTAGDLKALIAD